MNDRVRISIVDGIADVRLNRADKMNALDPDMFEGIIDAIASLASDSAVRVVVLSGEGRAFCAGLDFESFRKMGGGNAREPAGGVMLPGCFVSLGRWWRLGPAYVRRQTDQVCKCRQSALLRCVHKPVFILLSLRGEDVCLKCVCA